MAVSSLAGNILLVAFAVASFFSARQDVHDTSLFQTSSECMACHNSLTTPSGEDVSIGADWRSSMMANSSRDPYWAASVRRETVDHPGAAEEIENECSVCHMPMLNTQAKANGQKPELFRYLPGVRDPSAEGSLAADGVSCTLCHQITDTGLGSPNSFTGGYVIDTSASTEPRPMFGRFEIDKGHTTVMRSATGYRPAEAEHITQSELCATCHTLYTNALDSQGRVIGRLPEQMPYFEWRHSSYREEKSCQACHMPVVEEDTPITSILGEPRKDFSRHSFRGGNFFMLRVLARYGPELNVQATTRELDAAVRRTLEHLRLETATLTVDNARIVGGRLNFEIAVQNLSGHKFPTAYPSRRAWLHVTVRNQNGEVVFESGAIGTNGAIIGNDNDADASRFEPHYLEIRDADQVQIYESMMVDGDGVLTTSLLSGLRYAKDNRLLPNGFDKTTAQSDIAVVGDAQSDADFIEGEDRVRYSIDAGNASGALDIQAELRFQPISFRWADNLRKYDNSESRRFMSYWDSMSEVSSEVVSRTSARIP